MEFTIPSRIRDFVFDLHQATRKSLLLDEVTVCYDSRYKELNEQQFSNSAWPNCDTIAADCNNDKDFLLFYKEMTARHAFAKLKTTMKDFTESWNTYQQLFAFIATSKDPELCLTVQWVSDILSEYVYQFQGFCQYRTTIVGNKNASVEDLKLLEQNKDIWILPSVYQTLLSLIHLVPPTIMSNNNSVVNAPLVHQLFHTFATVEMARLECLLGDYTSSLKFLTPMNLPSNDYRMTIIKQITSNYINVFYHSGVSQLMLRRHVDALDTFIEIALFLHNILKPIGNAGGGGDDNAAGGGNKPKGAGGRNQPAVAAGGYVYSPLTKIMDKILALLCITVSLCPGHRLDDQIRELIENNIKYNEKLRKLQLLSSTTSSSSTVPAKNIKNQVNATAAAAAAAAAAVATDGTDASTTTTAAAVAATSQPVVTILNDMYESACPKYINPAVPAYMQLVTFDNLNSEFFNNQVTLFIEDSNQLLTILKIRSYLKVYATIVWLKWRGCLV